MKNMAVPLIGLVMGSLISLQATAETIAVIGTGNVGAALGPEFAALGHTIVYGSREPERADVVELVARTGNGASAKLPREAVQGAGIVVLAVPGTAAVEIARGLGDLSGKILLDPTNVVDRTDGHPMHGVAGKGSNAQMIQDVLPGARVVKAFNTLNNRQMTDPETAGGPITIPLASDDAEAKAVIAELVEGMGLEPLDVGPLAYAHILEEMLAMWAYSIQTENAYNFYLRPMP